MPHSIPTARSLSHLVPKTASSTGAVRRCSRAAARGGADGQRPARPSAPVCTGSTLAPGTTCDETSPALVISGGHASATPTIVVIDAKPASTSPGRSRAAARRRWRAARTGAGRRPIPRSRRAPRRTRRAAPSAHRARRRTPSAGTLRLSTLRAGASSSIGSTSTATVPRCRTATASETSTLTASAEQPKLCAVSAAPTVPECRIARPVLQPGLMPDTTMSGGSPNAPSRPAHDAQPRADRRSRTRRFRRSPASRPAPRRGAGRRAPDRSRRRCRCGRGRARPPMTSWPAAVERGREHVQPGRLDPVVVGYEDPRHGWQC